MQRGWCLVDQTVDVVQYCIDTLHLPVISEFRILVLEIGRAPPGKKRNSFPSRKQSWFLAGCQTGSGRRTRQSNVVNCCTWRFPVRMTCMRMRGCVCFVFGFSASRKLVLVRRRQKETRRFREACRTSETATRSRLGSQGSQGSHPFRLSLKSTVD